MPPWQFPQVAVLLLILAQASVADVPKQPAKLPNGLDGSGRNCLYIAIKSLEGDLQNLTQLEEVIGPPPVGGYTMATLAEAAEHFGLNTLSVQTSVENLDRRPGKLACIAYYDRGHYVVVSDLYDGGRGVKVIAPPQEAVILPRETFDLQWSGKALLLSPNPLLAEEDLPIRIPWSTILWGAIGTLLCAIMHGLGWKQVRQLGGRSPIAITILCISGCGANSPEAKVVAEGNATGPNIVIEDAKRELCELSAFSTTYDVDDAVEKGTQ